MAKFKVSKGKTIAEVVKNNLCTGCGTCAALCPLSAIEMVRDDSKGVYVPKLDSEKCNQCGICYQVCPGHSVDFKELNQVVFNKQPTDALLGNYLNCYIGHATDWKMRYNSASGGLVTALLISTLEEGVIEGALVTRMRKDNPLEPEPFIARTREEIISAAKSKYCPVSANIALKEILDREGKYAVVGLPCHLHGIRKAEMVNKKLKERIALHIGICCSGTPNFRATESLLHRQKIASEEITALDYRGEGWPGGMSIQLKDGTMKFFKLEEYYDNLFGAFKPYRCLLCHDHTSELADISFGDAWHEKRKDKVGTSIVVSRTEEGEEILRKVVKSKVAKLSKITDNEVKKSQDYMSFKKRNLEARIVLSKFLWKKTPSYNINLPRSPVNVYLDAVMLCVDNFLINHNLYGILKYEIKLRSKIVSWRNKL